MLIKFHEQKHHDQISVGSPNQNVTWTQIREGQVAHNLHIEIGTGKVSMMYVGGSPWHGLGTKLDKPATAKEAIKAAGLDWEVEKRPLQMTGDGTAVPIDDRYAVVRSDLWRRRTNKNNSTPEECPVFGIVGKGYTPLQNREAFSFFDDIVGKGAAIYHTAGALGQGERVWILAKLPDSIRVADEDITDKYLLLSNSHDGGSAVQVKFTPIRVVCENTLTMALRTGTTVRVAHTKDVRQWLKEAERMLGLIHRRYEDLEKKFKAMSQVKMDSDRLGEYVSLVFPEAEVQEERAARRVQRERALAQHFFESGKGNQMKGVKGTLWAAYNGVTEYVDHRATGGKDPSSRLESVWFGNGYLIKVRAFEIAENKLEPWRG